MCALVFDRVANKDHRLVFVFINSFYSFYWDVAKDWDLHLFGRAKERNDPEYPYGLRRHRYFRIPEIYYVVIAVDLMLRCTWSFKLSPHLDHFNDLEGGIFMMELLEVFRRWIWIFFRVETEWGEYCPAWISDHANDVQSAIIEVRHLTTCCWATSPTGMTMTDQGIRDSISVLIRNQTVDLDFRVNSSASIARCVPLTINCHSFR